MTAAYIDFNPAGGLSASVRSPRRYGKVFTSKWYELAKITAPALRSSTARACSCATTALARRSCGCVSVPGAIQVIAAVP